MQLRDYLNVAVKHRWFIIIVTCITVGLAYMATMAVAPLYRSTASVFVSLPYGNTPQELSQGSTFAQSQMLSYAQLATMPVVLQPVIKDLDLETTPKALAGSISTRASTDSTIMEIQASDESPAQAAEIANAVAEELGVAARKLSPKNASDDPTVDISVVGEAVPPSAPYSPKKARNLLAALLAGVFLAYAIALLKDKLDTRLRSTEDVTGLTSAPVLAEFGDHKSLSGNRLVMRNAPLSPVSEEFRRLRSNLRFLGIDRRPMAVVVTSSLPGEGKSTVLLNLGLACAQAGDRVLVVDADLRKPSIAEYLGLEGSVGLTTVLTGEATFEDVVYTHRGEVSFDVVVSGVVPPNPLELLGSNQMAQFIEKVRPHYDVILLDTAPLMPVIDAAVLAHAVTGAIFVTSAYKVRKEQVEKSLQSLDQAGARVLGVVVNRLPGKTSNSYYGYTDGKGVAADAKLGQGRKASAVT